MKLWEAILAGSKLRPQTFGDFFQDHGSCALGAALEIQYRSYDVRFLKKKDKYLTKIFPVLKKVVTCPHFSECSGPIIAIIPHLNDEYRWSREAIAEWVKVQEDRLEKDTEANNIQKQLNLCLESEVNEKKEIETRVYV